MPQLPVAVPPFGDHAETPAEKRLELGLSEEESDELDRITADTDAEILKMLQSKPVRVYAPLVGLPEPHPPEPAPLAGLLPMQGEVMAQAYGASGNVDVR